jgi:hypothetical protein
VARRGRRQRDQHRGVVHAELAAGWRIVACAGAGGDGDGDGDGERQADR